MPRYKKENTANVVIIPEELSGYMEGLVKNDPTIYGTNTVIKQPKPRKHDEEEDEEDFYQDMKNFETQGVSLDHMKTTNQSIDDAIVGYHTNEKAAPPHRFDLTPKSKEPIQFETEVPEELPGVCFKERYVYTKDGCMELNSDIPNIIATLNNEIMKSIPANNDQNIANSEAIFGFNKLMYMNIISTNLISTINAYIGLLNNIYCVFLGRLNSDVLNKYGINKFLLYRDYLITPKEISEAISYYIAQDDNTRQIIIKNYFQNYMFTYTNRIGMIVYTDTMNQLALIMSDVSMRPDKIVQMYESIDKYFRAFMGDLNFEAGTFIQNIINSTPLFLNNNIRYN